MNDEKQSTDEYKPRPRAADDADVIAARIAELRKERDQALNKPPESWDMG